VYKDHPRDLIKAPVVKKWLRFGGLSTKIGLMGFRRVFVYRWSLLEGGRV